MAKVDEIAPDVFRISILEPQFNLQFNHFLIRDEEPLLFHAGYKRMFPELREAVTRLLSPESIRWVSFAFLSVIPGGRPRGFGLGIPRYQPFADSGSLWRCPASHGFGSVVIIVTARSAD